jgi:hypothetical protein
MLLTIIGIVSAIVGIVLIIKFGFDYLAVDVIGTVLTAIGVVLIVICLTTIVCNGLTVDRVQAENIDNYQTLCELKTAALDSDNEYIIADCNNRLVEWNHDYEVYMKCSNNIWINWLFPSKIYSNCNSIDLIPT